MTNEFWNSLLTEKSWTFLQELRMKYNFILIGGWAVYLLTRQKKSKDIDIVIDIKELQKFKNENLSKNERLKKYEIKRDEIDVDIYVEYFSKLTVPVEDIKKYFINVEGFKVAKPEVLLMLKQGAYAERKHSVKGEKDAIDIVSLLFFSGIHLNAYKELARNYKLEHYISELIDLVKDFKDYNALELTPHKFKVEKEKILSKL